MFDIVDAAKSSVPPPSVKRLIEDDEERPDMDDIRNAIKVIGVIKKLINSDQLVLKPSASQNGLVKKGLIPVEESRKFKSRVGSHKKSLEITEEEDGDEDGDEVDEDGEEAIEEIAYKSEINKSKKEVPKSQKVNVKVGLEVCLKLIKKKILFILKPLKRSRQRMFWLRILTKKMMKKTTKN